MATGGLDGWGDHGISDVSMTNRKHQSGKRTTHETQGPKNCKAKVKGGDLIMSGDHVSGSVGRSGEDVITRGDPMCTSTPNINSQDEVQGDMMLSLAQIEAGNESQSVHDIENMLSHMSLESENYEK